MNRFSVLISRLYRRLMYSQLSESLMDIGESLLVWLCYNPWVVNGLILCLMIMIGVIICESCSIKQQDHKSQDMVIMVRLATHLMIACAVMFLYIILLWLQVRHLYGVCNSLWEALRQEVDNRIAQQVVVHNSIPKKGSPKFKSVLNFAKWSLKRITLLVVWAYIQYIRYLRHI
jgi:phosphatidylglycerophosphate synthase